MELQPGDPAASPAPAGPAATSPAGQGPAVQLPEPPADEASKLAGRPATAQPPAAEPASVEPPGQPAPAERIIAAQKDGQLLASDVVGVKAVTPNGDNLGKIGDLIVGDHGKIEGAVLSVGGFLGIGDKHVAVPWSAIQERGPDQPPMIDMTKDQLEAAPDFETLADQRARQQAALSPPPSAGAVPAPATGGSQ